MGHFQDTFPIFTSVVEVVIIVAKPISREVRNGPDILALTSLKQHQLTCSPLILAEFLPCLMDN